MPYPDYCARARRASGPKTDSGKAISARNSTAHGLFARDIVLTQLGEDPNGYNALLAELCVQINPRNLIEQHYVEVIAAASWRLRRLHRWQGDIFADDGLTDDERFAKLDCVLRHETALLRQIDKALHQLAGESKTFFAERARQQALIKLQQTEAACAEDAALEKQVNLLASQLLPAAPVPEECARETLDAKKTENCQNELPALTEKPLSPIDALRPDGSPVYLDEEDIDYLRWMVAKKDRMGAKSHLRNCRDAHLLKLREQALTIPDILAQLGVKVV